MKLEVVTPTEVEFDAIRIAVSVQYGEEDMSNDFPFRNGDMWDVTVGLDDGRIRGWPEGREAEFCMKVCDCGSYYLLSGDKVVAKRENNYVPSCIPGSYGDYIEFKIRGDGSIENWSKFMTDDNVGGDFEDFE